MVATVRVALWSIAGIAVSAVGTYFRGARRGGRVVDRGGLENRFAFTGNGGSNPSLSAFARRSPTKWT